MNKLERFVARLDCVGCRMGQLAVSSDAIRCSACGADYRMPNGVPRFVPDENYAGSFGFQWNKYARTQLDSFSGTTISHDRLFGASKWPADLTGQTILEAGSGAGRFTEPLATTGADIVSMDLSSAVEANQSNNGHNPNVLIVQGSILDIPVRPRSMDKVICLGVLQHTPNPRESFMHLAECVKENGELVIDVYAARPSAVLSWKYLLRPLTKRMDGERLYSIVERWTPRLLPVSNFLHRLLGRVGSRLMPICHYPNLGLRPDDARQWAILDTFDMYSPAHDHPQSIVTVRQWFADAGCINVIVENGPNGVVGRGQRPAHLSSRTDAPLKLSDAVEVELSRQRL